MFKEFPLCVFEILRFHTIHHVLLNPILLETYLKKEKLTLKHTQAEKVSDALERKILLLPPFHLRMTVMQHLQ